MNNLNYYLFTKASTQSVLFPRFLAQIQMHSIQDLKAGVGQIAGIIIVVSWVVALLAWFGGAAQKDSNPAASKACFYIVWMFAIGGPVVGLVYYMFVGASGTPSPTF
jgi:hypothetical protein